MLRIYPQGKVFSLGSFASTNGPLLGSISAMSSSIYGPPQVKRFMYQKNFAFLASFR